MTINLYNSTFAVTTYTVGTVGLHMTSIELILSLFIIYIIQFNIDAITGYRAARKEKKVLSGINIQGLIDKFTIFLFWGLLIVISSSVYNSLGNVTVELFGYNIYLSYIVLLIPHTFGVLINFGEFISIVENMSIIFKDKKEGPIFRFIDYLSKLIFNTSMEVLTSIVEKKINKKFEKYISENEIKD